MNDDTFEKWSFLWSEARLLIAAVALFIGGVPPLLFLGVNAPAVLPLVSILLKLAWIVSGVASTYLLYRWVNGGMKVFGGQDKLDVGAFLIMAVSGINLGITGVLGTNIGMMLSSHFLVFIVTAVVYVCVAVYLYRRWNTYGKKLF